MKKVTGIGGIFFKCQDPKAIKEWYHKNLGLETDQYGAMFAFRKLEEPKEKAYLQWSPFAENTEYFQPSEKQFMINYRVDNLEALLVELEQAGVTIIGEMQTFDYGKFAHILDPEGNKIELWEPVDTAFDEK